MDAFSFFFLGLFQVKTTKASRGGCVEALSVDDPAVGPKLFSFLSQPLSRLSLSKSSIDPLDVLFTVDRQRQRSLVRNTRSFDDAQIVTRFASETKCLAVEPKVVFNFGWLSYHKLEKECPDLGL